MWHLNLFSRTKVNIKRHEQGWNKNLVQGSVPVFRVNTVGSFYVGRQCTQRENNVATTSIQRWFNVLTLNQRWIVVTMLMRLLGKHLLIRSHSLTFSNFFLWCLPSKPFMSNLVASVIPNQGPVVQSVVSLTRSLRVISLTVLVFSDIFCWKNFSKKFQHICVSLDVNFNDTLTNDIVSFQQLGPD